MSNYKKHLIHKDSGIKVALAQLDALAIDAILFVVDDDEKLIGSLTDGDVRRGFLRGLELTSPVSDFIQPSPRYIRKSDYTIQEVIEYREKGLKVIPVIDENDCIVNVLNFRFHKSYLPVGAIIMAGGRGERLRPLTDQMPKPLLKVGDKPIIEHSVDRLISFGIDELWISVRYMGEQIEDYFKDGSSKGASIKYIWEDAPLGTIGAAGKADISKHDYVLISNSDILTNLDYEDLFLDFIKKDAKLSIVTIPYNVDIPYAVLETTNENVLSFREKPTYTYYSNGGIYLLKKECLALIPKGDFFNATDLMEKLIAKGEKVVSYPLRGYWLDIGRHDDYTKAQEDIKYIKF
jgi:dTDP-glucose pyrophosphorylase